MLDIWRTCTNDPNWMALSDVRCLIFGTVNLYIPVASLTQYLTGICVCYDASFICTMSSGRRVTNHYSLLNVRIS